MASIDVLGSFNFTEDVLMTMIAWAASAYNYYGGQIPKANGVIYTDDLATVTLFLPALRALKVGSPELIKLFQAPIRVKNAQIISKNVLSIEKKALERALAEDIAQLENGKNLAQKIRSTGGKPNPHGLQLEIDEIIPRRIKYKRDRINEINKLLGGN